MSVIVISGANRGIGLGLCKAYQAQGHTVVALCRKSSEELAALDVDVVEGIDVGDPACADHLNAALGDLENIDVLINVAGIWRSERINNMNFNTILEQFDINSLGPLRVTMALLPKLKQNAKVAMITSRMGSITDNTSGGRYGYRMSKAALNAGSKSLAHDLKAQGIAVGIYHPGRVQTDMTDHDPAGITIEESVNGLMDRIDALNLDNAGTFFHANGEVLPW
jgi:NAD(P)-dependent dehydrogenase (short-subunit alcohol dehydrogenase family)